jgi:DNA-directed RNA polymerase alpha subunit
MISSKEDLTKLRLYEVLAFSIDGLYPVMDVETVHSMKNIGCQTIADLVVMTEEHLLAIQNLGSGALADIAKLLNMLGLNFGMDVVLDPKLLSVEVRENGTSPQSLLEKLRKRD